MILMLLDSSENTPMRQVSKADKKGIHAGMSRHDQGSMLQTDEMSPGSVYTAQLTDGGEDRLFTLNYNDLMAHPKEIFGDQAECALVDDYGTLKWVGYRKIKKLPRRVVPFGKVDAAYVRHYRERTLSGHGAYQKRLALFDKDGRPVPATIMGHFVADGLRCPYDILTASLIEDALRGDAMLASIADAVEIKFPVPLGDYQEVFRPRSAPLSPSGRRRAIIHWVGSHIRSTRHGAASTVKKHIRGVKDIVIDGLKINITPNTL